MRSGNSRINWLDQLAYINSTAWFIDFIFRFWHSVTQNPVFTLKKHLLGLKFAVWLHSVLQYIVPSCNLCTQKKKKKNCSQIFQLLAQYSWQNSEPFPIEGKSDCPCLLRGAFTLSQIFVDFNEIESFPLIYVTVLSLEYYIIIV